MALGSVAHHEPDRITVGVDTHEDTHTAAILGSRGATIATRQFAASRQGYEQLEAWAQKHGQIEAWGIEGTASYGAGLTRFLVKKGHSVKEVIRPNRKARRRKGKSDPIDAQAAARACKPARPRVLRSRATGRWRSSACSRFCALQQSASGPRPSTS